MTSDPEKQKLKTEDPLHYHGGAKARQGHLTIQELERFVLYTWHALRSKMRQTLSRFISVFLVYLPNFPTWPSHTWFFMVLKTRWIIKKDCGINRLNVQMCRWRSLLTLWRTFPDLFTLWKWGFAQRDQKYRQDFKGDIKWILSMYRRSTTD